MGMLVLAVSVLSLGLAQPAQASAATVAEARIFQKINAYRVANGKPALAQHSFILSQVRAHAQNLPALGYPANPSVAHDGFNQRALDIQNNDGGIGQMCENVAWAKGYTEARRAGSALFKAWKNSPPHNNCMLDLLGFTSESAAVGVHKKGSRWWAVFIAADDSSP